VSRVHLILDICRNLQKQI